MFFHATGVVAARLGRAVSTFKTFRGATASKLLWWKRSFDDLSTAEFDRASGYHTKDVVGEDWQAHNYLQLLLSPKAGVDMSALLDPDIGNNDNLSSGGTDRATASGRSSAVDPD